MKLLEPKAVTLGDNTFYIRPLPAMRAANLTAELSALVIPLFSGFAPILAAAASSGEETSLFDIDINEAAPAIANAFASLSGDKLEAMLRHLLIEGKNIAVEGPEDEKPQLLTKDLVDELFCEDVQDMFLLAFEVIRRNYNGFFKKLASRFGPLKGKLENLTTLKQSVSESSTSAVSAS